MHAVQSLVSPKYLRLLDTHTPTVYLYHIISSSVVLLIIRVLTGGFCFASDALVFTLGLTKYEPRRLGPTDEIVNIRLQGITVCGRIDAVEDLGTIGVTGKSRCLNSA